MAIRGAVAQKKRLQVVGAVLGVSIARGMAAINMGVVRMILPCHEDPHYQCGH